MDAAGQIVSRLEDYPVLDEDDLCERGAEDASRTWDLWAASDFRRAIVRAHELSDLAADALDNVPSDTLIEVSERAYDYETHDDGAHFPHLDDAAREMPRATVAALIRKYRRA
jgi:hypothetical protein